MSVHPTAPSASHPRRRAPRRTGFAALALTAGLLAPVLTAAPASAHDALRSTVPADGTTVDTAPDAVELQMSSTPLGLGTQVQVTGPGGVVSTGDAQVLDTTVSQALAADRPAGEYTVQWRVTSSDGHPVSGSFRFTATTAVGAPSATASTTATAPATTATPSAEPSGTAATSSTAAESSATDPAGSSSGLTGAVVGLVVVVVAAVVLGVVAVRRRRNR